MKNVKLMLLTITALLFLGMENVNAQEKEPNTVIIRSFELFIGKESQMTVTSPDGTTKSIKLQIIDLKTYANNSVNNTIMQSEINYWKKQGFIIEGFSSDVAANALITTIILSKDE